MLELLNRYCHGYVAVPVILCCRSNGLFEHMAEPVSLSSLSKELRANSGHLHAALHMLESLGWAQKDGKGRYMLTVKPAVYEQLDEDILEMFDFPIKDYLSKDNTKHSLKKFIDLSRSRWNISEELIADFLDGLLIIPLLIGLKRGNFVVDGNILFSELGEVARNEIAGLLLNKQWLTQEGNEFVSTSRGHFFLGRIFLVAIVFSYSPMLRSMNEVIFGDSKGVFKLDSLGNEQHIDRSLNVLGSGFQHKLFFSDMENIIISLFDNDDFENQPRYIADCGSGDGTLLKQFYNLIKEKSLRGRHLDKHPLKLIAIDFNDKALDEARKTLKDHDCIFVKGDIGRPEDILASLEKMEVKSKDEILHIRSFLDHNRFYVPPKNKERKDDREYSGVYVDEKGNDISPEKVVQNLVEHLKRWASIIGRHGLIILEVHCLEPSVVNNDIDSNECFHFDAFHSFSSQLLVEADVFLLAASQAGLFPDYDTFKKYPRTMPYSRITLGHYIKQPFIVHKSRMADLQSLANLEKITQDKFLQDPKERIRKRIERFSSSQLILEKDKEVLGVLYCQRILDSEFLKRASQKTVESFHVKNGQVLQLLKLVAPPNRENISSGDILINFALLLFTLKNDVKSVTGVSRCKDYAKHKEIPFKEYVFMKKNGLAIDPILRFHESHGAKIKEIVFDYFDNPREDLSSGILIDYGGMNAFKGITGIKTVGVKKGGVKKAIPKIKAGEPIDNFIKKKIEYFIKEGESFSFNKPFMEMGLSSLDLMELRMLINAEYRINLDFDFFFKYPTSQNVVAFLQQALEESSDSNKDWSRNSNSSNNSHIDEGNGNNNKKNSSIYTIEQIDFPDLIQPSEAKSTSNPDSKKVAIIGIAGKFPGSPDVNTFWKNLISGKDLIKEVPKQRWNWKEYYCDPLDDKSHCHNKQNTTQCKWGGFVDDVDKFDPLFFNISPGEAELIDPQHRLFLECVWQAIEDAGYKASSLAGSDTGVFLGISENDYFNLLRESGIKITAHLSTGNYDSISTNRISYLLDIHGPSEPVDTACSSSLVAIHKAVQAIRYGECNLAIAGGVHLILSPALTISFDDAGMLSKDGRCKTFDKSANGYVRSEAVAALVLKPLDKAVKDNDHIYGVVIGSAVNHGGLSNSLTAPNPKAQKQLLKAAYKKAGVDPRTITYIEAHGTGTSLGDPIEVKSILAAFKDLYEERNLKFDDTSRCAIGSVKTSMGHAESAAGIAGVVKVLLAMKEKRLPGNIHLKEQNLHIQLEGSPFYLLKGQEEWHSDYPCRAGISGFGFGGANAHVILEEFVSDKKETTVNYPVLIPLSAKNEERLKEYGKKLLDFLKKNNSLNLGDLAYTLQIGREAMEERIAFLANDLQELIGCLQQFIEGKDVGYREPVKDRKMMKILGEDNVMEKVFYGWIKQGRQDKLAELWVRDLDIDWDLLYPKDKGMPRRISLPTYPFARESYWIPEWQSNIKTKSTGALIREDGKVFNLSNRESFSPIDESVYIPKWVRASFPQQKDVSHLFSGSSVLFFSDENSEIVKEILKKEPECIQVRLYDGAALEKQPDSGGLDIGKKRVVDINDNKGIKKIVKSLSISPKRVYFLSEKSTAFASELQAVSLFRLIKALLENYLKEKLDLSVLTECSQLALAGDTINPAAASLVGLASSFAKEHPVWNVRCIDFSGRFSIDNIFNEPANGSVTAYRDGYRYIHKLIPFFLPKPSKSSFRKGGVYVILGGAGGLGYATSKYLIDNYGAKIVWLGRRKATNEISTKIKELNNIPLYFQADALDPESMKSALMKIRKKYSRINGVIHSAIVLQDKTILRMSEEDFLKVLRPKVSGSINLVETFKDEDPDWICFYSSVESFMCNPGQGNYAAGCTSKDAFALSLPLPPVKVVNWGFWGNIGIVAGDYYREHMSRLGIESLDVREGMMFLEYFFASGLSQAALFKHRKGAVKDINIAYDKKGSILPASGSYLNDIIKGLPDRTEQMKSLLDDSPYNLDDFSVKGLYSALNKLVFTKHLKSPASVNELRQFLNIQEKYYRLFDELIKILCKHKIISQIGDKIKLLQKINDFDMDSHRSLIMGKYPGLKSHINLLCACLDSLPKVITGQVRATDVMFPNSSMELVEGIYKGNKIADYCNECVADIIEGYIHAKLSHMSGYGKVSILEVGAGTGGTSECLFRRLKKFGKDIEYVYTDISQIFLRYAEDNFKKDAPYLKLKLFDIEKPLSLQDIEAGYFDIVAGTNVLHATRNISNTLQNLKAALKSNGILVLNELSKVQPFFTLTFGLLDGWWLYEDDEIRLGGSPALSYKQWERVLLEEGFVNCALIGSKSIDPGQQVIVAESDGVIWQEESSYLTSTKKLQNEEYQQTISIQQKSASSRQINIAEANKEEVSNKKESKREVSKEESDKQDANKKELDEDEIKKHISQKLMDAITGCLKIPPENIDKNRSLYNYGIDSIMGIKITHVINETMGISLDHVFFFDDSNFNSLLEHVYDNFGDKIISQMAVSRLVSKKDTLSLFKVQKENVLEDKENALTTDSSLEKGGNIIKTEINLQKEDNTDILQNTDAGNLQYSSGYNLRDNDSDLLPLSYPQEYLCDIGCTHSAYNVFFAYEWEGVDITLLRKALEFMVSRYPYLLSNLVSVDGKRYLKTNLNKPLDLKIVSAYGKTQDEIRHEAIGETKKRFSPENDSLFKIRLWQSSAKKAVVLFFFHHLVIDGWSFWTFIEEFTNVYASLLGGREIILPPIKKTAKDYMTWQNNYLQSEDVKNDRTYWDEKLSGGLPILNLPLDYSRPLVRTVNGSSISFRMDSNEIAKLHKLSADCKASPFVILLAAYYVLLYRYTGQNDIIVATPSTGRTQEFKDIFGYFTGRLLFRQNLEKNPSFRDLVEHVRKELILNMKHQNYPFYLLAKSHSSGDESTHPIFQAMFALQTPQFSQTESIARLTENGKKGSIKRIPLPHQGAWFDLVLEIYEYNDVFDGFFDFNSDLFSSSTIERMKDCYLKILKEIFVNPEKKISQVELLTDKEYSRLILDWNSTESDFTKLRIHELFEEQVRKSPDKIAVRCADEAVSYQDLNKRSNRLAHYLFSKGVKSGSLVGIYLKRSVDLLASILAVLKTGAGFVPLDESFPEKRLEYMLSDSSVQYVITESKLLSNLKKLRSDSEAEPVPIDALKEQLSVEDCKNLSTYLKADNIAYVIYTSGSTGKPKGVKIPHLALTNFLCSMKKEPGITKDDVLLAITTISFDISYLELFLPVISGAQVVIAKEDDVKNGEKLASLLEEHDITLIQGTPVTWKMLLLSQWKGKPNLTILSGGEALSKDLASSLIPRTKALWNMYGPTETTIWSTIYKVSSVEDSTDPILIGRPIANTQVYVLNKDLQPCPVRVIGELYIAGDGLALGYLNKDELTSKAFLHNPFKPGNALMYKTGDLACWLADGTLQYKGRVDHQIKLNGVRVELGEIESVIRAHPLVKDAVVIASNYANSFNKHLLAYVIPKKIEELDKKGEFNSKNLDNFVIDRWMKVWDVAYKANKDENADPEFDVSGWNDSFKHTPTPPEEMAELVNTTVERILTRDIDRVLEIGCGTGLILFRVAPKASYYCGTDISNVSLSQLKQYLSNYKGEKLPLISLLEQPADNYEGIDGKFDTVIINSVTQHFPTISYLTTVIEKAISVVEKGRIFIGDIRNYSLLRMFQAALVHSNSPEDTFISNLKSLIEKGVKSEQQLLIHPSYFYSLPDIFPKISHVEIQIRRGKFHNEYSKYRYDATLYIGESDSVHPEWIDWKGQDISEMIEIAKNSPDECIGFKDVKNKRLAVESKLMDILFGNMYKSEKPLKMSYPEIDSGSISKIISQDKNAYLSIDPEDLYLRGDALSWKVLITWSPNSSKGFFDVVFLKNDSDKYVAMRGNDIRINEVGWSNKNTASITHDIIHAELESSLKKIFPRYMLPSSYHVLSSFPLTPNGKLDRKALPVPAVGKRPQIKNKYKEARDRLEVKLSKIWKETLQLDSVGVDDPFFDLGGSSLLLVQVYERIKEEISPDIKLTDLFTYPTISSLTQHLKKDSKDSNDSDGQFLQYAINRAMMRRAVRN